ncbi:MAG TPA: toxin VasX [Marinobacter sp.]|uniref:toxin VasX n=1 Tax=Marinobacter sp. TaxID=50741 RepID=UPI002D802A7B|nr:toxin VasX [Marinobacter sp.]HET8800761.1 toxin VasX [Marinobacter sp.]
MTRIQRPTDDRASNDLLCWEQPGTPVDEPASCPLLKTVHLLPIRYGRVEVAPADTDPGYPYSLTSRPLGYRLLRHGYLYVLDADTGELHEYLHEDGELTGHNDGKLEYPVSHTLYVAFSELAWTARKKAQVLDNPQERDALLQRIDLASASPLSGGQYLLTPDQAREWVAEFAEDYTLEAPEGAHPQEGEPYHWENQPYYHKSRFGKLIKQQNIDDVSNCLCLVVRDDVGVMLDLAQHQDDVVGWLESWTEEGDDERDYFLGTLIESMTLMDEQGLDTLVTRSDHPAIVSMRQDLEAMSESERSDTQSALLEALRQLENERRPGPNDASLPAGAKSRVEEIRATANRTNAYGILPKMQRAVDEWYVRQAMEEAKPDFVDSHIDGIVALEKDYRKNLKAILEGRGFGHRGVNDLIDRDVMDQFMAGQRAKLARWQTLLTDITSDRLQLLTNNHYQQAAWYFDPADEIQIEAALDLEYACLKDICRSDDASEGVLEWLEQNPQYSRPLFQTLPKGDRSEDGELAKTYVAVGSAGYAVVTRAAGWVQRIKAAEEGKLPDFSHYTQQIQDKAALLGDTISPAIAKAKGRAVGELYKAIGSQSLPDLDDLFRDLPYFFKRRMLDAIDQGKAEFRFASASELATFRDNVTKMLQLDQRMKQLQSQHDVAKSTHGHLSETAQGLVTEFKATREEHREIGRLVAAALSPVEETDTSLKLEPADTGRAALTLVPPALVQQEIGRVVGHFRQGLASAPRMNLMGDGLGVLVFVAQLVNLVGAVTGGKAQDSSERSYVRFAESALATSAAGFLAAQGLMDTAYSARAQALASAWQRTAVTGVHIRMGKLHVGLGIPAYLFGAISAGISAYKHRENWLRAVQSGNAEAQVGAVLGMVGSGGLAGTNAYGLYRTGQSFLQALASRGAEKKAIAWATTGQSLSRLFFRLNMAGLAFTVFELGGTWMYNRYNLSERDKWLQTTPWSREAEEIHNGTLEDYAGAFARIGNSVTLDDVPAEGDAPTKLQLNCHGLPAASLMDPLEGNAPHRVSIAAWRVQPGRRGMFSLKPETWVPCTGAILVSLEQPVDIDHLQLTFTPPAHEKTRHGIRTRDLNLMVKLETLQEGGGYTASVYMLKVTPGSRYPLTPIQEPPEEKVTWWQLRQPFIAMEGF